MSAYAPCASQRCDTLPEALPTDGCPTRGTGCQWVGQPSTTVGGRALMRNVVLTSCLGAVAAHAAGAAQANDELIKMSQNPKDWVMSTVNSPNQLSSQHKQITAANVGK